MIAVKDNSPRFTPEEYFDWEEQQLVRHEYIDGKVYAMTGGTINHSEIASNFASLLKNHPLPLLFAQRLPSQKPMTEVISSNSIGVTPACRSMS